jgi:exopolysaccharide biosynthesis polyprenyl glycosylphosphotransferase
MTQIHNSNPTTQPSPGFAPIANDLRSPKFIGFRRGLIHNALRGFALLLLDSAAIAAAWEIALLSCPECPFLSTMQGRALPLMIAIFASLSAIAGLYRGGAFRRNYLEVIRTASVANLLLFLVAILYTSAVPIVLIWTCSMLLLCVGRISFDLAIAWIRCKGALCYPVFLIADLADQDQNIEWLQQQNCYRLVGIADAHALDKINREATFKLLQRMGVVEVFIAPNTIRNRLHLCWRFQTLGITLRILLNEQHLLNSRSEIETFGGASTSTLRSPLLLGSDYWLKRCLDLVSAAFLVVLLSPLYVAIAIAIKLDSSGSIFFKQTRIGLYNRPFEVWKFRTMVQDASSQQAALEAQNEIKDGVLFKIRDDPRVTRIGKFLRRSSLDELPQLFNVLCGEMSLVGPRPLPLRDVEKFEEQHFIRQEVLPGITGLWQISGRSSINSFAEAIHLDLTYIAHWSLLLDFKILLKTVQAVLRQAGAY